MACKKIRSISFFLLKYNCVTTGSHPKDLELANQILNNFQKNPGV